MNKMDQPYVSAKRLTYALLLNTDTQLILDDYCVDYIMKNFSNNGLSILKGRIDDELNFRYKRVKIVKQNYTLILKNFYVDVHDEYIIENIVQEFARYGRVGSNVINNQLVINYIDERDAESFYCDRVKALYRIKKVIISY